MSKYGNETATALRGMSFKSKRERDHALWLESEKQAGRIKEWQYEKSYDLTAFNGLYECPPKGVASFITVERLKVTIGKHKPDFTVLYPNGTCEVHEIKGGLATKTEAWGLRRNIFKANYPHIRYKVFDGIVRVRGGRVIQFD